MIGVEFNFGAMMAASNPNELKPAAMVQLNQIQLNQAPADVPAGAVVVDASKVNPRKKGQGARR